MESPEKNNLSEKANDIQPSDFPVSQNSDISADNDISTLDADEQVNPDTDDTKEKDITEQENAPNPPAKDDDKKEDEKQSESKSSEHDGKYFVIPKGKACCDKGAKFPNFKVTSHQKHYWNDEDGIADYLAVTEDDLNFNPAAMPFGTCSIKNGNPCAFAPSGKWTKTYDKVTILGKSAVTELSELMCAVGGKITVMKHGQQSEAGKSNVNNADSREQQAYNPIMDFEEFQEEINGNDTFEVE
jgi:hypothetical protein